MKPPTATEHLAGAVALVALASLFVAAAAPAPDTKPSRPAKATANEQQPAGPREVVHRVAGLFARECEADLRTAVEKIRGVRLVRVDFDYAEATFAYDPDEAFPGTKPDGIVKRFNELLRAASGRTLGIDPVSTTSRDKLTRVEIPVAGLDCKGCSLAAYEILAKVEGVEQATASFREGRITALIDPAKTSRGKLEAALTARGVTLRQP